MYKLFSFLGDIENWWAPGTDKLFKEKAECIIKQYGNFVDQSVISTKAGVVVAITNLVGSNITNAILVGTLKDGYLRNVPL